MGEFWLIELFANSNYCYTKAMSKDSVAYAVIMQRCLGSDYAVHSITVL